ncbi:GRAS family transcription factor [Euphorbia peplus]|nr:GRAS family transcription factor [Euphorbia peplus]
MDTLVQEFPNSMNNFRFENAPFPFSPNFNGYEIEINHTMSNSCSPFHSPPPEKDLSPSSSSSLSSLEGVDPNNNVCLKFISDILMEEDLEGKTCMLQDCLALQAAEKSLYDALGQEYPHSLESCPQSLDSPGDSSPGSSRVDGSTGCYDAANVVSVNDSNWVFDLDFDGLQSFCIPQLQSSHLVSDAGKFSDADSFVVDRKSISPTSSDKEDGYYSPNGSRGRKNHQREGSDYLEEERTNKHSALSLAESEQSAMFDEVLLCQQSSPGSCSNDGKSQNGARGNRQSTKGRTSRGRRQGKKGEVVDLPTLLTQCAHSVAISDQRTAAELLRQIRQHSSPHGDGNQRLAHHFANALEIRLAGAKTPTYSPMISNNTPVSDILKAYQVYVNACPFQKMSNFFANHSIYKLAEKATRLHIVDFGILYGFQWPCLIQRLSERIIGPPTLRITAIELPQPGFRPAERVEETGRRLQRYCERFRVPFEFNFIAQKWETIKYEDLNIKKDEMTVVNCLYRMRHVPDDTVVVESARDAVLKLVRSIRPQAFIHGVVNGTYNAPFFVTRFREALFHFSSIFDMYEANVPREDEQRRVLEKAILGRDIMNVIACEGTERIERPETYKQWQVRNTRGGLRQVPLDQEILKKVRSTVRSEYHKDFLVDENGQWMLQGWKGRVMYALSVWKPVS